jgi:A/G-specific adenine glycosylase
MANRTRTAPAQWSAEWLRSARLRLMAWYGRNARDLPWRRTSDPYAIWVSEIMLQQTQVATVLRYYPRFLAAFPMISSLAAASEREVLRLWEGLGYYRRARQMHATARLIVKEHRGRFPPDVELIRLLPGIGRYTAGAILSIAFDQRQPILEANTVRLLSRLLPFRGDTASAKGQKMLWRAAEELLPKRGCGRFNQALMELGSLVCTPRDPKCECCPLQALCPTHGAGWHHCIPQPRRRPAVEDVREIAVIVFDRGRVLLRKCGNGERWAGLWDFPRFAATTRKEQQAEDRPDIVNGVRGITGERITRVQHFTSLQHGVTRFRIALDCYLAKRANAAAPKKNGQRANHCSKPARSEVNLQWLKPAALADYPLSTTGRKLARLLVERLDRESATK